MAYDLMSKLDGIPSDSAGQYNELILNTSGDAELPSLGDLQKWQDDLFSEKYKDVRTILEQVYGLDETDLRASKVGLDESTGEVALPTLNGTGANPSGVKFLTLDKTGAVNRGRFIAVNRLLGYSYRSFHSTMDPQIILAENDFDRLYLQKIGFLCVTSAEGLTGWDDSFTKLLKGKEVAAALTEESFESDDALKVLTSIAGKAKRLVRMRASILRKRSKPDIEEAIRLAPTLSEDILHSITDIHAARKGATTVLMIHPSQEFLDGLMFYGVMVGETFHLLTSERKLFPITPDGTYELIVEYDDRQRLDLMAVEHYLDGSFNVNPSGLLEEIKSYIRRFVVLTEEDIYTVLATWVMGTYIFRVLIPSRIFISRPRKGPARHG